MTGLSSEANIKRLQQMPKISRCYETYVATATIWRSKAIFKTVLLSRNAPKVQGQLKIETHKEIV